MSEDTDLDQVFAAARAVRPVPSDALTARVLHDAYAAQPVAPVAALPARGAGGGASRPVAPRLLGGAVRRFRRRWCPCRSWHRHCGRCLAWLCRSRRHGLADANPVANPVR